MLIRPCRNIFSSKLSSSTHLKKSVKNIKRKYTNKNIDESFWVEPKIINTLRTLREEPTEFEEFIEKIVPVRGDAAFEIAAQIYIIAAHTGHIDFVEKDLIYLYNLEDKGDLLFAFNDCFFEPEETSALFRSPGFIKKLGIHPTTSQILGYLSEEEGVDVELILWAVTDFLDLLKKARKEVDLTLFVPAGTDKAYQDFLVSFIKNEHDLNDSQLELSVEVDPKLYGGYRVLIDKTIHDRSYNASFSSAGDKLKAPELQKYEYIQPRSTLYEDAIKILSID